MKNHADMSEEITDRDEAALISLEEIKCSYFHDDDDQKKSGFKLEFFFYPNPYFGNSVLTKTYHLSYEQDDELVLESATGTEIEWYQGKCLTQKTRVLRRNGKGPEPKTEDCESFFNFFKSPRIPKDGEEELDEDAAEEVQNKLEQDYDMACTLRDKIVPHAVSWFTGEAAIRVRDDWPDDDDEEDNEDEDEDEDDEDEDDEDDDDEDEVITDMKESAAEVSHLQHCERPPECIQQ
ncbi:Nucleosome assembly protein 1-like 4 [Linum grandiflorum]